MDLSVITVTWNSKNLIGRQVESVRLGCKKISFEQIVGDNASTDGTVELLEKEFGAAVMPASNCHPCESGDLIHPPKDSGFRRNDNALRVLKYDKNTGFGFPNNEAAKISSGDFLLFLNPDMKVGEGSLDTMVDWMRSHPDVGIASCKLVDENGKLNEEAQPRCFPGLFDQTAILLKLHHIFPTILNKYLYKDFDANKEQEVESVRGSFFMMRREVYEKLGRAFDPRYFIWFEDVDLCREVKKMRLKVVYTPIISCVDYVGQSFKKSNFFWKQKQFIKSMLQYFWRWRKD